MESISLPDTLPAPLQQVHLAHFSHLDPETQSAAIIRRIIAASQLLTSLDSGASEQQVHEADAERAKLDFAFLDPTRLCSKQHVLAAVTQAALVCARSWDEDTQRFREGEASLGGMKSKTPHSEIIYMLNPGNNVGESLKRFGLSPKSTSLLLVTFSRRSADPHAILQSMFDVVAPKHLSTPSASLDATSVSAAASIDQAIRFGSYPPDSSAAATCVTDWKQLNKIYKLQIPSPLLHDLCTQTAQQESAQSEYEEIICTCVAMKLVAA